jgi:SAM-dependent methyltransferase
MPTRPAWQLPPGVSRGGWDYAQSALVAEDYDNYFRYHGLFKLDQELVEQTIGSELAGVVIDLGCGTGRHLLPLAEAGHTAIGVDFSRSMLRQMADKADSAGLDVSPIECNLVQLDGIASNVADNVVCMFSTLGMIQGRQHRQACLRHMQRILKPGGRLLLHLHNYWFQLFEPSGLRRLIANRWQSLIRRDLECGDNEFVYRGIPRMFLHAYRRGELRRDLLQAGFQLRQLVPVAATGRERLPYSWWWPGLRAAGWLVEAVGRR